MRSSILLLLPTLVLAAPADSKAPRGQPQCTSQQWPTLSTFKDSAGNACSFLFSHTPPTQPATTLTTTQGFNRTVMDAFSYAQPAGTRQYIALAWEMSQKNGHYAGQSISEGDCVSAFSGDDAVKAQGSNLCKVGGETLVQGWDVEKRVGGKATVTFKLRLAPPGETQGARCNGASCSNYLS